MAARGNTVDGKIQRGFYLTTQLAEALRRAAFEKRESQSVIVETALRRYLQEAKEEKGQC